MALQNMSIFQAWMYCLLRPFGDIVKDFSDFKKKSDEDVRWNGQTIVLEYGLNTRFPEGDGNFYITNNGSTGAITYAFKSTESQIMYVFDSSESPQTYIHQSLEYLPEFDFTVMMPTAAIDDGITTIQVKAFVDLFKIAGKRYNIIIY